MQNKKSEKFVLSWICPQTGKKQPAGVAFYNETQGDYRLKIDALSEEKLIFLKPFGSQDGAVLYRVEAVVRKNGQSTHRTLVGDGYARSADGLPVLMDIGPYTKALLMEAE